MAARNDWPLTEAMIRQNASAESYQRGQEYERGGAVLSLVRRGTTLEARVEGSEPGPYRVRVELDAGGVLQADCTCPYDWGGWCKHIVATLLVAVHHPDRIQERPPLDQTLTALTRDQLVAVVEALVARFPALVDVVETQVAQFAQPAAAAPSEEARRERRTPVDARAIRREVRLAIQGVGGMRSSEAYWQVGGVADEIHKIAERAGAFLEAGDAPSALAVLDAVTAEYVDDWTDLDDSDGYLGDLFRELGALWAESLLSADLTREEREEWVGKLEDWAREVGDYGIDDAFDPALAALAQSWDDPRVRAMLEGRVSGDEVAADGDLRFDPIVIAARLAVLDRQRRYPEYLNLARASGQTRAYLVMLARLGRSDEAVAEGLAQLDRPEDALALAQALRERGELAKALRVGEHGLGLDGHKAPLAIWVRDLAGGMGERERAVDAAVVACREDPSLDTYQAVQELAGGAWPERKAEILDALRRRPGTHPRGEVDIFLHEGLVDDAIAKVQPYVGSYYSDEIIEPVIRAAVATHPQWVIATCTQRAEGIMTEGRSQVYDLAVRWLGYAAEASRVAGREGEWADYLRGLIEQHRRKYRLRPMLEALQEKSTPRARRAGGR